MSRIENIGRIENQAEPALMLKPFQVCWAKFNPWFVSKELIFPNDSFVIGQTCICLV